MLRKTLIACAVHTSGPTRDAGRCKCIQAAPPPPQAHRTATAGYSRSVTPAYLMPLALDASVRRDYPCAP